MGSGAGNTIIITMSSVPACYVESCDSLIWFVVEYDENGVRVEYYCKVYNKLNIKEDKGIDRLCLNSLVIFKH